jgi:hypothetical protein
VEELLFKSDWNSPSPTAACADSARPLQSSVVVCTLFLFKCCQSIVNLEDVAEAAALVLTQAGHTNAIYELVSPDTPSPREIAAAVSGCIHQPVRAEQVDRTSWENQMRAGGMNEYSLSSLKQMFAYYEKYNFCGNPHVLGWLLGREPGRLAQFLDRYFKPE